MKKLLCVLMIVAFALIAGQAQAAKTWTLFFMSQQEIISQVDGVTTMGYKLGPDDTVVQISQVVNLLTVGQQHCIIYTTDNLSIASMVRTWPEFMGFNYTDMIMRITLGLGTGDITIDHVKYITGAHWYTGGEWYFGSVVDWVTAGSPVNVWFGPFRQILGAN